MTPKEGALDWLVKHSEDFATGSESDAEDMAEAAYLAGQKDGWSARGEADAGIADDAARDDARRLERYKGPRVYPDMSGEWREHTTGKPVEFVPTAPGDIAAAIRGLDGPEEEKT